MTMTMTCLGADGFYGFNGTVEMVSAETMSLQRWFLRCQLHRRDACFHGVIDTEQNECAKFLSKYLGEHEAIFGTALTR
jgi:hypothetical protein